MTHDPSLAIRLPLGVRDFLPRAAARRRAIAEKLISAFEAWGYARIMTPMFERADVLERGLGADARAAAIRFVEPGTGEVMALRPDITPQIARIAATRMGDVDGPIRLCYEGAVTRMMPSARGQREILQAGVELIGADSPEGDAEVISVAANALASLGVAEVRLDIGHVAPARYALGAVEDPERRRELAQLLAKKDHRGVMRAAAGLPLPLSRILGELPMLWGTPDQVLGRARELPWPAEVRRALDTVAQVLEMSRIMALAELHAAITVDLGEVRGFEYYTGIRFAGYAEGVGDAILLGGRYDELVGRYGRPAHATGFAVDIEAAAQAQRANGIETPDSQRAVLVTAPKTPKTRRGDAAHVAAALRAQGRAAALDLGTRRGRNAVIEYARAAGFASILALGTSGAECIDVALGRTYALPEQAIASAIAGDCRSLISSIKALDSQGQRRARRP